MLSIVLYTFARNVHYYVHIVKISHNAKTTIVHSFSEMDELCIHIFSVKGRDRCRTRASVCNASQCICNVSEYKNIVIQHCGMHWHISRAFHGPNNGVHNAAQCLRMLDSDHNFPRMRPSFWYILYCYRNIKLYSVEDRILYAMYCNERISHTMWRNELKSFYDDNDAECTTMYIMHHNTHGASPSASSSSGPRSSLRSFFRMDTAYVLAEGAPPVLERRNLQPISPATFWSSVLLIFARVFTRFSNSVSSASWIFSRSMLLCDRMSYNAHNAAHRISAMLSQYAVNTWQLRSKSMCLSQCVTMHTMVP